MADGYGSNPAREKAQPSSSPSTTTEAHKRVDVLVIEDNRADVFLIEEAVLSYGIPAVLHVIDDGEKAIEFIHRAEIDDTAPCPALILLDLNLPKKSGAEILERLRRSPRCGHIPVIVVTSSDAARDREEAERLGATRYFRKPTNYDQFLRIGEVVKQVLAEDAGAGST